MTTEQQGWVILIALLSAVGGGSLTRVIDWWLTRGTVKESREDAQAAINDKIAAELRTELRQENASLRERLAQFEGQLLELSKTNAALREENLKLVAQNAAQAVQISRMQAEIDTLRSDLNRRPGTGPLTEAVGASA